jgi:hypothetical protein
MKATNKILVPIDFSEPSEAALLYGRHLAKAFGAQLHVLHVMENQFLRPTFKSCRRSRYREPGIGTPLTRRSNDATRGNGRTHVRRATRRNHPLR